MTQQLVVVFTANCDTVALRRSVLLVFFVLYRFDVIFNVRTFTSQTSWVVNITVTVCIQRINVYVSHNDRVTGEYIPVSFRFSFVEHDVAQGHQHVQGQLVVSGFVVRDDVTTISGSCSSPRINATA